MTARLGRELVPGNLLEVFNRPAHRFEPLLCVSTRRMGGIETVFNVTVLGSRGVKQFFVHESEAVNVIALSSSVHQ